MACDRSPDGAELPEVLARNVRHVKADAAPTEDTMVRIMRRAHGGVRVIIHLRLATASGGVPGFLQVGHAR